MVSGVGGSGSAFIPGNLCVADSGNSTTTASSPFTGTFSQYPYPWFYLGVLSDVAGTAQVIFSHDGSTTHNSITFTLNANEYLFRPLESAFRYVKVIVTVAGVSSLSVFSSYGFYSPGVFPVNGTIGIDSASGSA